MLSQIQVEQVSSLLHDELSVEISPEAIGLIVSASKAMKTDPHPIWMLQPQFRQVLQSDGDVMQKTMLEVLRNELEELASSLKPRDRKKIGFFHVLHWIADSDFFKGWPVPKDPVP